MDSGSGEGGTPLIPIPSLAEVEASQRPSQPPNLFTPSGAAARATSTRQGDASASGVLAGGGRAQWRLLQSDSRRSSAANREPDANAAAFPPSERDRMTLPAPQASAVAASPAAQLSLDKSAGQARYPPNAVIVNQRRQAGNPILRHIRNVRWVYATDIVPDFVVGANACALFISVRYHLLHPDYLFQRVRELQRAFRLRVVLCYVDQGDVIKPLNEITKLAVLNDCTLICAWSELECARYLETLRSFESKPPDLIMGRKELDHLSRVTDVLTTVRGVNKTDAGTLVANFSSVRGVMAASLEDMLRCPGIGERKARRLHDAFHVPFRRTVRPRAAAAAAAAAADASASSAAAAAVPAAAASDGERQLPGAATYGAMGSPSGDEEG